MTSKNRIMRTGNGYQINASTSCRFRFFHVQPDGYVTEASGAGQYPVDWDDLVWVHKVLVNAGLDVGNSVY